MINKLIVFVIFISLSFYGYAQPITYKLGKYYYEKGNYSKSLKWFERSSKKIDRSVKGEYYHFLYKNYLEKPNNATKCKAQEFYKSYKSLKKATKYKYYDSTMYTNLRANLLDSSAIQLIRLLYEDRHYKGLYEMINEENGNEFLNLTRSLYDYHKLQNLSKESVGDFCDSYQAYFTCENSLIQLNRSDSLMLERVLSGNILEIYNSPYYKNLSSINSIWSFRKGFLNVMTDSIGRQASKYNDTIKLLGRGMGDYKLKRIWENCTQLYHIDSNSIPQGILKRLYVHQKIRNYYNEYPEIINGCDSQDAICFDKSPIKLTVILQSNDTYSSFQKIFDFNELISNQILYTRLKAVITSSRLNSSNEISAIESFLVNGNEEQIQLIHEIIEEFRDDLFRVFGRSLYRKEYSNYHFFNLFVESTNDYILTSVNSGLFDLAIRNLVELANIAPTRDYSMHRNWFTMYFRDKLGQWNPTEFGEIMIVANHLFSDDQQITLLRKEYLELDYVFSHQSSKISDVDMAWDGNLEKCECGTLSSDFYSKSLERLKFFRRWVGVSDKVRFDTGLNKAAQQAALIMRANNSLTHHPSENKKCFSEQGYYGASHGNLYLGRYSTNSLDGYMDDSNVPSAGHRIWIMNPDTRNFGIGSIADTNATIKSRNGAHEYRRTSGSNCLLVAGDNLFFHREKFYAVHPLTWPNNGYFPSDFIHFYGSFYWSLSLIDGNFRRATVKMTQSGKDIPTSIVHADKEKENSNCALSSITWKLTDDYYNTDDNQNILEEDIPIIIEVDGVIDAYGKTRNFKYEVILFDLKSEAHELTLVGN